MVFVSVTASELEEWVTRFTPDLCGLDPRGAEGGRRIHPRT